MRLVLKNHLDVHRADVWREGECSRRSETPRAHRAHIPPPVSAARLGEHPWPSGALGGRRGHRQSSRRNRNGPRPEAEAHGLPTLSEVHDQLVRVELRPTVPVHVVLSPVSGGKAGLSATPPCSKRGADPTVARWRAPEQCTGSRFPVSTKPPTSCRSIWVVPCASASRRRLRIPECLMRLPTRPTPLP